MNEPLTGGCQCGAVRYEARPPERGAYFCHCTMCRRAVGHAYAAFVNLPRAAVAWSAGEPASYRSSAFATRGFCRDCGTPLTFAYDDSAQIDLTVGSFDDPSVFTLESHFAVDTRLEGFRHSEGLPEHRLGDHKALVERWVKHYGKLPD